MSISSAFSLILALLSPSLLNNWLKTAVYALPGSIYDDADFNVVYNTCKPLAMICAILSPIA